MTLPWSKLPRSLRGDWRLTQRSPEALAAFFLAWLAADDGGTVGPAGATRAVDALASQLSTHRPGDPLGWAVEAVRECFDAGLLESLDDGDALRVVDWLDAPAAPQEPTAGPTGTRPASGPRAPGRPRKADAMSPADRKRRERFDSRAGSFRDVPAGVTWEQWRAENPVTETPAVGHGNPAAVTKTPVVCHGNSGHGHGNSVTKTLVGGRASGPEDQKDTRNTEQSASGAREPGHGNSVTETPATVTETPAGFRDQPPAVSCSTVENLGAFDALDLLDRMRRASGDRLATNLHTATTAAQFAEIARDLIVRKVTTLDGFAAAAAHAAHDPWVSAQGKLPLARLLAADGKILLDLIAGSSACARCGSDPVASGVFLAPARDAKGRPAAPPAISAREYIARREAANAARAASVQPALPEVPRAV